MVERAVELVEPVDGGQELIAVAQMVLAELAGGVALGLEQLGDGHVAELEALRRTGHADFGVAAAAQPATPKSACPVPRRGSTEASNSAT